MPNAVIHCIVDSYGDTRWYNALGALHRTDGPAFSSKLACHGGSNQWFMNGLRHREDGPAIEYYSGDRLWYLDGKNYSEVEFKHLTRYRGRVFKKKYLTCRGCGKKVEWIVGTSKRSYACIACRAL